MGRCPPARTGGRRACQGSSERGDSSATTCLGPLKKLIPARSEAQRHLWANGMKGNLDFSTKRGDPVDHARRNHGCGSFGNLQRRRILACKFRLGAEEEAGIPARSEKNQGLCFRFLQRALSL